MISRQTNLECLAKLGMLRHFPTRDDVLAEIGKFLNELCQNDGEAKRLVAVVCGDCDEWCGPAKLRAIYSSAIKVKPSPYFDTRSITDPQWVKPQ
jgi:hypothetical protein